MFPEKTGHSPSFHSGLRVLFRKVFFSLFLEKKRMSLFLETCKFSISSKETALRGSQIFLSLAMNTEAFLSGGKMRCERQGQAKWRSLLIY